MAEEVEIDQMDAFYTTLREAHAHQIPTEHLNHLDDMWVKIKMAALGGEPFSEAKLGRWLGWAQATVVFHSNMTMEDFRRLNWLHRVDHSARSDYAKRRAGDNT